MSETTEWTNENEQYLIKLSTTCGLLADRFRIEYHRLTHIERFFKVPIIILSSITGLISMLNTSIEDTTPINITVAILSLIIASTNSTEAYLKLGQNISGSIATSKELSNLKEKIDCEVSLQIKDRTNDSVLFLKECHHEYLTIIDASPPLLKRNRYILELTNQITTPAQSLDNETQDMSKVIIIK